MHSFSYKKEERFLKKRWLMPALFVLSLMIAVVSGLLLFSNPLFSQLASTIISFGLDPSRSQLIAALIMAMGAALVGAASGRQKLGAVIGSALIFWSKYLNSFIQLELQPSYDPGGHLEPLDSSTLVHTVLIMLALMLLAAFFGAVNGVALGEILIDPPCRLLHLFWLRFFFYSQLDMAGQPAKMLQQGMHPGALYVIKREVISWGTAALLLGLLLLVSQSGPLFLFSPDVGIHTQPVVTDNQHTQARTMENGPGTLKQDSLISPALNNQRRSFVVYLPPSYNTPAGAEKRYPVLYLLHGSPGGENDWFTAGKANESADTLIDAGQIPESLLVSPDGNGRNGTTSEWGNSGDQSQLMETFVADDLVKYVDQHYRTIPDAAHRAIGGLSMGGFGGMNIALHHPEVFGTVISLGGYYQAEGEIWGHDAAYIQQNSPAVLLPHDSQAWKLHIYLGAASQDQPYYDDTRQFMKELVALHIPYQFDLQNGYHSWRVWQVQMYDALHWIRWG
jgi:enterochelin esterase-like enzyme